HRECLLLLDAALAAAAIAGFSDDLSAAFASRARLLNREEALLHAHLAGAAARLTLRRLRAWRCAVAFALLALDQRREFDLGSVAEDGLLEIELEVVAQVRASIDLRSAATAAAEDVAEDVTENIAERIGGTESAGAGIAQPFVTEAVVGGAL